MNILLGSKTSQELHNIYKEQYTYIKYNNKEKFDIMNMYVKCSYGIKIFDFRNIAAFVHKYITRMR